MAKRHWSHEIPFANAGVLSELGKFGDVKRVQFLGRNGWFNIAGLQIGEHALTPIVSLRPVTSKGRIGRACLEIPLVDLPAVVKALAEIADLEVAPAGHLAKVAGLIGAAEAMVAAVENDEDNAMEVGVDYECLAALDDLRQALAKLQCPGTQRAEFPVYTDAQGNEHAEY